MQTENHAHTIDRISLPRRLVPRRPSNAVSKVLTAIAFTPPSRFFVGDIVRFQDVEGWTHIITILGTRPCGFVDAMTYDGRAHYIGITLEEISALRVIRVERMDQEDVDMYRRQLGLAPEDIELTAN
ncbi:MULTISPECIES: hypothetical protein [unclassified Rhizobium]|uniref:hypothetical protein n=1 Tax=unclassified Rhizobium TaxID=2613769 RepID=UPI0006F24279|nr:MULTISPECIES: hypothetical protein [unclassified Rhizobium]KQV34445.1 hypothetical protein ASC86_16075 [Rhizobium sp. Root1212]KRD23823.1 hypothetical protein ASE37_16065 [Rhizobium sp. Root268]